MENSVAKTDQQKPMVPGFGVAGFVICPFMSLTHPAQCVKQGCELWVELNCGGTLVARCGIAWLSVLSTEVRGAIDKLAPQGPKTPEETK